MREDGKWMEGSVRWTDRGSFSDHTPTRQQAAGSFQLFNPALKLVSYELATKFHRVSRREYGSSV